MRSRCPVRHRGRQPKRISRTSLSNCSPARVFGVVALHRLLGGALDRLAKRAETKRGREFTELVKFGGELGWNGKSDRRFGGLDHPARSAVTAWCETARHLLHLQRGCAHDQDRGINMASR